MTIHQLSGGAPRLCAGLLVAASLAVTGVLTLGCGPDKPDEERIAGAIAHSDSLRQDMRHRHPQSWERYPVASRVDSDSVIWLNASPGEIGEVH